MRALTPVTNAAMVIDSGSTSRPMLTCRWPAEIQVNQVWVYDRPFAGNRNKPMNTTTVTTNEVATIKVASQPARGLPSLRPDSSRITKPASGSSGTRNTTRSTGAISPSVRGRHPLSPRGVAGKSRR